MTADIDIELVENALVTTGLRTKGFSDLRATVPGADDVDAVRHLLETFAAYQIDQCVQLRPGEKVGHGYWMTRLEAAADGVLDIWEIAADGEDFVPGVAATIRCWVDQVATCERAGAGFQPPSAMQMAAMSIGVMERNVAVSGVRYRPERHMSGWFLYTDLYDGDIKTMRVEHLFHITERRPDLTKYLALPPGFRFTSSDLGDEITFDHRLTDR